MTDVRKVKIDRVVIESEDAEYSAGSREWTVTVRARIHCGDRWAKSTFCGFSDTWLEAKTQATEEATAHLFWRSDALSKPEGE